jgi:SpoVK/Ycf46/Vps4 family AAA+-type ATPase
MATADQIRALIQSHLQNDNDRFMTTAIQVAAHAARQGKGKVAEEIRKLVDDAKEAQKYQTRPIPIATPKGDLATLLSVSYPDTRLSEMVLSDTIKHRLNRILREQRGRQKLLSHGLHPRGKLLLVGPPGSGKTMTAAALSGELGLPLYTLQLHGLLTKYMGETAAKLRLVFDALNFQRGVYLFDEFDALGSHRSVTNDVGEIRRVLNSFLQFLEQDESSSLLIAATNHPESLDPALFRRFDDVVEYEYPSKELLFLAISNKLATFDVKNLDWDKAITTALGLSYADIIQACESAAKDAVLNDTLKISTLSFIEALEERKQRHL